MSVGVLIQFASENKESTYLPLATEIGFAKHWVNAAKKRDLTWIPQFQTGVPVPVDALDAVIEELRCLYVDFQKKVETGEVLWASYVDKIAHVLEVLSCVDRSQIEEIFIG